MNLFNKIKIPFLWIEKQFNSLVYNPLVYAYWKKKALNLWKMTGYQIHVMPMQGNKMILMSKKYSKPGECISLHAYNKAMKGTGKQLDIVDVLKMSYYSTPAKRC